MTLQAIEFKHAGLAFQHMDASGWGDAIVRIAGRFYLTTKAEARRAEAAGLVEAYYHDVQRGDGRYVTVAIPVKR